MNDRPNDTDSRKASERYRRVVESIDHLPSLPQIVTELLGVVNSADTSADDAVRLIERDPALASKYIRLANSAFYGMPRTVASVSGAVVILGFNVIRSVVLSASIVKLFPGSGERAEGKERFWRHSIAAALAAKEIAGHLMSFKMLDPEAAFCAGLLHDLGKLIFNEFVFQDYRETADYARRNGIPIIDAETCVLGINHARIGRIIADKWALPIDLEKAIVNHHDPAGSGGIVDLVVITHVADGIAHDIGAGAEEGECEARSPQWREGREYLHIDDEVYERIRASTASGMENAREYLSIIS